MEEDGPLERQRRWRSRGRGAQAAWVRSLVVGEGDAASRCAWSVLVGVSVAGLLRHVRSSSRTTRLGLRPREQLSPAAPHHGPPARSRAMRACSSRSGPMSARVLEGQGAGVAVQELRRPGRQIRAGETRAGRRTAWIRRRMPGFRRRQSWAYASDEGAAGQGLSRPPPARGSACRRRTRVRLGGGGGRRGQPSLPPPRGAGGQTLAPTWRKVTGRGVKREGKTRSRDFPVGTRGRVSR